MNTTRREFLKTTSLAAAATATGTISSAIPAGATPVLAIPIYPTPPTTRRGDMLFRQLGSTGEEVSLIGLGGYHIGKQKAEAESLRIMREAIDAGITFMDNCWDYHKGVSEIRMGKALKGRRDKVFLMSKIDGRTRAAAARQIDESLRRLQTDRIDLMQHHEIIRMEDPDRIFASGGAHEALVAAQKAGKIRFLGFTGHKDPLVHNRMLDIAAQKGVRFDAVQMPLNVMDVHFRSFQLQVMPRLVKDKVGVLAMKTFGDPLILEHVVKSGTATPTQLLHYSMTLPVATVITGIDSLQVLKQATEAARTWKPMAGREILALISKMRAAARDGQLEKFKTSARYDGTAKNPHWLG